MDAEIQFFMSDKDQEEFLEFVETQVESIEKESIDKEKIDKGNADNKNSPMRFILGDCALLFTPSILEGNTLFLGNLEIRLGNTDLTYKDLERAKSAFRKLRNKLKKTYVSRLAYVDKNKRDRLTPSRVHWLGPDAKAWKKADPDKHILKLSKTSWMVFEIGF